MAGFDLRAEIANKPRQQAQMKRFNRNIRETVSPPQPIRFLFLLSSFGLSGMFLLPFFSLYSLSCFFDPRHLYPSECDTKLCVLDLEPLLIQ